jgi:uncharacterized protein (TIGR02996 family)
MTERDALLAAIIAQPDDDTVRLVYAYWLDEHGESIRATIIRAGVAHPWERIHGYRSFNERRLQWAIFGSKLLRPRGSTEVLRRELPELEGFTDPFAQWFYYRGFLHDVEMTRKAWKEHGETPRLRHPINAVRFRDSLPVKIILAPFDVKRRGSQICSHSGSGTQ